MLMLKCDRCGKCYDIEKVDDSSCYCGIYFGFATTHNPIYRGIMEPNVTTGRDLCPDCMDKLKDFFERERFVIIKRRLKKWN